MGQFLQATATYGRVLVNDANGNTTELAREQVRQLLDVCITALGQPTGCRCGDQRVEVVEYPDNAEFFPRKGCATCDTWDGPPILRTGRPF